MMPNDNSLLERHFERLMYGTLIVAVLVAILFVLVTIGGSVYFAARDIGLLPVQIIGVMALAMVGAYLIGYYLEVHR